MLVTCFFLCLFMRIHVLCKTNGSFDSSQELKLMDYDLRDDADAKNGQSALLLLEDSQKHLRDSPLILKLAKLEFNSKSCFLAIQTWTRELSKPINMILLIQVIVSLKH